MKPSISGSSDLGINFVLFMLQKITELERTGFMAKEEH